MESLRKLRKLEIFLFTFEFISDIMVLQNEHGYDSCSSYIGDLYMIIEYCVRAANSLTNGFTITNKNLHDAEVSVRSIKQLNEHLPDELKFHGWVTIWEGYELDDHSKVTVAANLAKGLDF